MYIMHNMYIYIIVYYPFYCDLQYIFKTCNHRLPVYLNSINSNNNELNAIISITDDISLSSYKNRINMCLLESYTYYCDI